MKAAVIYHADCADGFAAAWVASRAFYADLHPVKHGDPFPKLSPERVFIVDFSYPRAVLEEAAKVHEITVLDHHKTALADLEPAPAGVDVRFDQERSGAGITWDYFHPCTPRPPLIAYVEDRDLWRFELPDSREVNAYIRSFPYELDVWSAIDRELSTGTTFVSCADAGRAILRAENKMVRDMVARARKFVVAGHAVPAVNATVLMSEVCNALLDAYPEAPFSASCFLRKDGAEQWSLRGRKGGMDVSEIARVYGGGGHAAAAGFVVEARREWEVSIHG